MKGIAFPEFRFWRPGTSSPVEFRIWGPNRCSEKKPGHWVVRPQLLFESGGGMWYPNNTGVLPAPVRRGILREGWFRVRIRRVSAEAPVEPGFISGAPKVGGSVRPVARGRRQAKPGSGKSALRPGFREREMDTLFRTFRGRFCAPLLPVPRGGTPAVLIIP